MYKYQTIKVVNMEKAVDFNFEHESFGFFSNFGHTKF
jgi:hypothetical protein